MRFCPVARCLLFRLPSDFQAKAQFPKAPGAGDAKRGKEGAFPDAHPAGEPMGNGGSKENPEAVKNVGNHVNAEGGGAGGSQRFGPGRPSFFLQNLHPLLPDTPPPR